MPAPVVAGEGMKFVDDDGPDVLEELPMVDLGGDQDDFERFGRGEQAIGRIGEDPPLLALGRVAVPAGGSPSNQLKVALEPLLLIVQQGPDRADVEDHRPVHDSVSICEMIGKNAASVLPPAVGARMTRFAPSRKASMDSILDGPQLPPAEGVDDVVLEGRVQSVECAHRSSSMSSTVWAWASRSTGGHLAGVHRQLVVLASGRSPRTGRSGPARRRRAS